MENLRYKAPKLLSDVIKMASQISEESIISNNMNQYLSCFEKENGKFKCSACSKYLADKSCAIRHLKSHHPEIAAAVNSLKHLEKKDAIEIRAKTNPTKVMNAIIQLIIFHALPFAILNSKGFRYLVKPYIDGFNQVGINFSISRSNVQLKINETANRIKVQISKEVKGRLVCLLLDIASRYNRSILGISIVYWFDGKPHTKTIGMESLKISQTGRNLHNLVVATLTKFGISLEQLFSVTTDNGKNLVKMVKIMRSNLNCESANVVYEDRSDDEITDDEDEFDESNTYNETHRDSNGMNEEIFDPEIFNEEYFTDLLTSLRDEFDCSYNGLFNGLACAAHTLNLVVKDDIINCAELKELIEKFRTLAKKLRTPTLPNALKEKKQKMALIDVNTRWSSLHNMVSFIEKTM